MNICWLYHDWSKWTESPGTRVFTEDKRENGYVAETVLYITQERTCAKCGMLQLRAEVA